jgi:hypothetical protein
VKVRIRYIEEIEQPLREEIGDLRQRLAQEQVLQLPPPCPPNPSSSSSSSSSSPYDVGMVQDNVFVCKRQIEFFKSSMEAEREGHALELQRVLVPFEMREQELKAELLALQQALDDA